MIVAFLCAAVWWLAWSAVAIAVVALAACLGRRAYLAHVAQIRCRLACEYAGQDAQAIVAPIMQGSGIPYSEAEAFARSVSTCRREEWTVTEGTLAERCAIMRALKEWPQRGRGYVYLGKRLDEWVADGTPGCWAIPHDGRTFYVEATANRLRVTL